MRWAVGALALLATSCAAGRVPLQPVDNTAPRLAEANQLVHLGCYTCLLDALRIYEDVLAQSQQPQPLASSGAARAALLLDFRQRELGMVDDGYRRRAETLLRESGADPQPFALWFETLDLLAWPYPHPGEAPSVASAISARQALLRRNADAELASRRIRADEDPLSAYAWVAFFCAYGPQARSGAAAREPLVVMRELPLVEYASALCGTMTTDVKALAALLEREPRFLEIDYWLGRAALVATDLEGAEERLTRVYRAHPRWPMLTVTLGHVSMGFEDMDRARTLYEETLSLTPDFPDALVGRVRALGYLGRHGDALEQLDEIQARRVPVFAGETFYWRAWNLAALDRLDEAWESVEQARALWVNNEVAKLAGLVAYRRRQLDVSYARFTEARKIDPTDCEVLYNIGQIDAEERRWSSAAETLPAATSCLERTRESIRAEIARLRASEHAETPRVARQIANREARIGAATRMLETAWFNLALSHFNLSHPADARSYAERLADHPLFSERAREILSRLPQ